LLWCALTTRGQMLNAGADPWWLVSSHRGSATQPEAGLMAGKHSSGGGRLSHLRGSSKEQWARW
jgi:hypothetical protein